MRLARSLSLRCLSAILACSLLPAPARAGSDLPAWAREAMTAPTPPEAATSRAVVLLREESLELIGADRFVERHRRAVRILGPKGAGEAIARAVYSTDGGKVRSLKAWIVTPSGKEREIPGKQAVDLSLAGNDVYNEARLLSLSGEADAVTGSTFAWESTVEGRNAFAQFDWYFQDDLPTVRSEIAVRPLPGWTLRAMSLTGDSIAPVVTDGWWRWRRDALAPIEDEPFSPPMSSIAPRLAVSLAPSAGSEGSMETFDRWADVSAWLHKISDASGEVTPAIAAKARSLAAGAATRSDTLRAIARFCQAVNYISIQLGLSRGGGYVPHAADEVLRKGYGDCKDKANLMRSMLRALGIDAYLCAISAFDPYHVRESWPTPAQFDHCILAVRSDENAACAISTEKFGRLVFFDPTDPTTAWGDLPEREQGGWALPFAENGGDLVRVPTAPPERNAYRRRIDGRVSSDGSVAGTLVVNATGAAAARWRSVRRERGTAGVASSPQLWLGSGATAAKVDSFTEDSGSGEEGYAIRATFRIPRFGRPMGGTMIVLEPARLSTIQVSPPDATRRPMSMLLPMISVSDEVRLSIPEGYVAEGLPPPVSIEVPYGKYTATFRAEGSVVSIDRAIELRRTLVPASETAEAREFLLEVRRALDTPLVLAKR